MKIATGPVKNAISLGDMFHDALLSMFQAGNPNATDEQIAEAEKGTRELIESVADVWKEEVSKPLMAIEKLGKTNVFIGKIRARKVMCVFLRAKV